MKIVSGLSCGNVLPQKSIGFFTELEDITNLTVFYINLSAEGVGMELLNHEILTPKLSEVLGPGFKPSKQTNKNKNKKQNLFLTRV